MCQPSPSGSGNTHGSRNASSCHWPSASTSYQSPSARSTGLSGDLSHVIRSSEVAYPIVCTLPAGVSVEPV